MKFPKSFIRASEAYNTFEHHVSAVSAPRISRNDHEAKANVIITALGFYELYLNERITKDVLRHTSAIPMTLCITIRMRSLRAAKMCLACEGNGFTNNPGGHIWDFDIAAFRAAPQMALCLTYTDKAERHTTLKVTKRGARNRLRCC